MDARLTPEQEQLRHAAAKLAADLGPGSVLDLDDADRRARLEQAVAATGWRALRSEGASGVEVALVAEEFGRGLVDVPFIGPVLADEDLLTEPALGADLTGATADIRRDLPATPLALVVTAADILGAARGAHALAVGYAKVRAQYGRAIGSYQGVSHPLAEGLALIEGGTSVLRYAAWAVDEEPAADAARAATIAKLYCARAARTICEAAIQVHGGIGNTWECLAHVYLRRVLVSAEIFPVTLEDISLGLPRLAARGFLP
ncbi:MAG: acyl-CoA dehydrogenase family protein [Streptosporangiaceae bacterium]|jgi:acyl-CoA dehydrogenase-like protein